MSIPDDVETSSLDCYPHDYFHDEEDDDEEEERSLSWRMDPELSLSDWTLIISKEQQPDGLNNVSVDAGLDENENTDENEHDDRVGERRLRHHPHEQQETTYHVHKNILAVGPCKSEYFASVFRNPHLVESVDSTSRIRLQPTAAAAMPYLLDFLYSPTHELNIDNPKTAVSLRHLSQYFGMKLLYRRVMEYCKNEMSMPVLHMYVEAAELFGDERMLAMAADLCVDHIQDLQPSSPLLQMVDTTFFLRILSSDELDTCNVSRHLSAIVTSYCQHHRDNLNLDMFRALTDRKYVPIIDKDCALPLLELEAYIDKEDDTVGSANTGNDGGVDESMLMLKTPSVPSTPPLPPPPSSASLSSESKPSLSCLQRRCVNVLSHQWKRLGKSNKAAQNEQSDENRQGAPQDERINIMNDRTTGTANRVGGRVARSGRSLSPRLAATKTAPGQNNFSQKRSFDSYKCLSAPVLLELLQKTLQEAESDLEEVAAAFEDDVENRVAVMTSHLEQALQDAKDMVATERAANLRLQAQLNSLRSTMTAKDRELIEHRREWNRLIRVPVDVPQTFHDTRRSTYHHQTVTEPFDNPGNIGTRYGRARPTVMPSIGDAKEDGYLLLQKNGPIYERYPLFYYKR